MAKYNVANGSAEVSPQSEVVLDKSDEAEQTVAQRVTEVVTDVLFYLLLVAILAGAIMFASSKTPGKSIFGYRYYDVLTGSMEPTYNVGDLIFVKVTDPSEINVGDPATFNPGATDDSYLTHRVIEKLENYQGTGVTCFRTKGDANDTEDPFVIDESRMIGVVKLRIPLLGYVVQFVQYHYIMVIVFIVLISLFFSLLKKYVEVSAEITALEKQEALEDSANGELTAD